MTGAPVVVQVATATEKIQSSMIDFQDITVGEIAVDEIEGLEGVLEWYRVPLYLSHEPDKCWQKLFLKMLPEPQPGRLIGFPPGDSPRLVFETTSIGELERYLDSLIWAVDKTNSQHRENLTTKAVALEETRKQAQALNEIIRSKTAPYSP